MKRVKGINIKQIIYFQIVYNLFIKLLISDFNIPSVFNYFSDLINLCIFIYALIKQKNKKQKLYGTLFFPSILLLIGTISFVFNYSNFLLFFWAIRNTFRFYMFFVSCIILLDKDSIVHIFRILEKVYIVNLLICLYEYIFMNVKYDNLGGIFGNNIVGGNGPLNVFLIIMITYSLIEFFYKKKSIKYVLFTLLSSLAIASVAELKIVFIETVMIFIILILLLKKNMKLILISLFIVVLGYVGLNFYASLYPDRANFLSIEYFLDYGKNTTYGDKSVINRFSAFEYINEHYFLDDTEKKFIGIGLGNAEVSQFDELTSDFYIENGQLLKYNWFSHVFMYIETGIFGIISYLLFFVKIIKDALISKKKNKDKELLDITIVTVMLCFVFFFYNQTLRLETTSYLLFFILSIPYILKKEWSNKNGKTLH